MGRSAETVQEWFSLNQDELIHCPYQLGNLKITRSSCLLQRRRSRDWVYGTTPDNYLLFALEMHLKHCKDCDQVEAVQVNADSSPGPNSRRFQRMGWSPGNDRRLRIKEAAAQGQQGIGQPG